MLRWAGGPLSRGVRKLKLDSFFFHFLFGLSPKKYTKLRGRRSDTPGFGLPRAAVQ